MFTAYKMEVIVPNNSQKKIVFWDNGKREGHIKCVDFQKSDDSDNIKVVAPVFVGAPSWQNIPTFSVLTGRNGSGKSQLLEYIQHIFRSEKGNIDSMVYINSFASLTNTHFDTRKNTSYYLEREQDWKPEVLAYFSNGVSAKNEFAQAIIRRIDADLSAGRVDREQIDAGYVTEIANQTISYEDNRLDISNPLSALNLVLFTYQERLNTLRSTLNSIAGVRAAWKWYSRQHSDDKECVPNSFPNSPEVIDKLLDAIGKESSDSKQLGNTIHITRGEVNHAISSPDNYYTADFINLLLHNFNQETLSIQVYLAMTPDNVQEYFEKIQLSSAKDYHFIPLNVAYDENNPQHKNHWVAIIIDKKHQFIFYLDPAQKQAIPSQVIEALNTNFEYQNEIILNPTNFQQREKQEDWLRHCGMYVIEIFKIFRQYIKQAQCISGSLMPDINIDKNSASLQTALSGIPCGEAEVAAKIRQRHIGDACTILGVDLENSSEIQNTQFKSSESLGSYSKHVTKCKDFEEFIARLDKNAEFRQAFETRYLAAQAGPSPIETVERIMKKYAFPYRLVKTKNHPSQDKKLMLCDAKGLMIDTNKLSSGELMLLNLIAWLFYAQGLISEQGSIRRWENKMRVILLDEPDKHLDPKLCAIFYEIVKEELVEQQNIQVIIVSHRLDMVSLAPERCIFLVERNAEGVASVRPVHKLQALFRMSTNLRDMIDYHHKVYVESAGDALFYEAAYSFLKQLCDRARSQTLFQKNKNYFWQVSTRNFRLLSNRYQMSFYSVSEQDISGQHKKKEGGCDKVKACIVRDTTAIQTLFRGETDAITTSLASHWHKTRRVLSDPRLYRSYGVLDKDYGTNHTLGEKGIEDQVVVLRMRYSVENFLFDPILFCSVLTEEEIYECINGSNIAQPKGDPHKKDKITSACIKIKNCLVSRNYDTLQEHLTVYFVVMLEFMSNFHQKYRPENKRKREEEQVYGSITKKIKTDYNNSKFCDTCVTFIVDKYTGFSVQYPSEFLDIRGHDIEEFFFGKKNKFRPADKIIEHAYSGKLTCIPMDLAEVFFDLNDKIRDNATAVVKPSIGANMEIAESSHQAVRTIKEKHGR